MKLFYLFVLVFFQASQEIDVFIENMAETYSNGSYKTDSFEYIFPFFKTLNNLQINVIIANDLIFNVDRQYEIINQDNISIMFEYIYFLNFFSFKGNPENNNKKIIFNSDIKFSLSGKEFCFTNIIFDFQMNEKFNELFSLNGVLNFSIIVILKLLMQLFYY